MTKVSFSAPRASLALRSMPPMKVAIRNGNEEACRHEAFLGSIDRHTRTGVGGLRWRRCVHHYRHHHSRYFNAANHQRHVHAEQ